MLRTAIWHLCPYGLQKGRHLAQSKVKKAMREYVSDTQRLGYPSAPDRAITVLEQVDRPQPRLDRDVDRGYSVSVGRVREEQTRVFDLMFAALSHNSKFTSYSARLSQLINTLSCHRCCWIINTKRKFGMV